MPFKKGNEIGKPTRFQPGQSGNPGGRPPNLLKEHVEAELAKIGRERKGDQEAVTKLQVLAETLVDDAIDGCLQSRKLLIDRIYPAMSKHEIAAAGDREVVFRWQTEIEDAARELDRRLGIERDDPKARN
jgi:hypothetical protein